MKLRKNNFLFLTQFIQFPHGAFSITWMLFIKYINRQKEYFNLNEPFEYEEWRQGAYAS